MPNKPQAHNPRRQHRRAERRLSAARRGYDAAWQRVRLAHIQAHPLCVRCEAAGHLEPAQEVDHVEPFDGPHDPLRLDPRNLQSLCKPCHSRKTVREDGGFGRK